MIETLQVVLFLTFVLVLAVQLFFALNFYWLSAFRAKKNAGDPHPNIPLSVIVMGRNEKHNVKKFLPRILNQDYPNFEVIYVNDLSWDGTRSYIESMQEKFPNLRLVNVPATQNDMMVGKKFGLTLGIKAAKNPYLIFTDADCFPASNHWLKHMSTGFQEGKELVLGWGMYASSGGFVGHLQQFEGFQTAMQYSSLALGGMPYMGVGRNLGYTKDLFLRNKGFAGHLHISSGDDDLFVNKHITEKNFALVHHPDSHTISPAKKSWAAWFQQKQRHFSTVSHYRGSHQFILGLMNGSLSLFYLLLIILLILSYQSSLVLILAALRWVIVGLGLTFWAKPTGKLKALLTFPVSEFLVLVHQSLAFLSRRKSSSKKW